LAYNKGGEMLKNIRNRLWLMAERDYALADRDYRDAAKRRNKSKAKLIKLMEKAGLDPGEGESVYAEGDILKVRYTHSAGRVTMDAASRDRLFADNPQIDRTRYEKVSRSAYSFSAEVLPGAVIEAADADEEEAA
jgi:hypothetical protein